MKNKTLVLTIYISLIFTALKAQSDFTADTLVGCDSLHVNFVLVSSNGVSSVSWDFGNGKNSTSFNPGPIKYDSIGSFDVSVVINNSDTIKKDEYIHIYPTPTAQFSHTDTFSLGSYNILFQAEQQTIDTITYNYSWNLGDGSSFSSNSSLLIHRYDSPGEYTVNLVQSDYTGCSNNSSDTVIIENKFSVQKYFTPNDDGVNDIFTPYTNGQSVYEFKVFTRNGTLIYKSESPIIVWDGTNTSGVKVNPGIYYYIIKQLSGNTNNHQTGFIYVFY